MRPVLRIRELREARGLTQEALARRADVSLMTIQRLEGGSSGGSPRTLRAIAKALGLRRIDTLYEPDGDREAVS